MRGLSQAALPCLLLCSHAAIAGSVSFAIVDANNAALPDAVVYLTSRDVGASTAALKAVEIDQVDKEFVPLVSVFPTNTPVSFPNRDNIRHHVYSFSPAKKFDLKLYSGRPSAPVIFDKPGVITLGCNIHDRMIAWILVVDSPWYAKSDAAGRAMLANIPDGEYEVHTWHPGITAGMAAQSLRVGSEPLTRSLKLNARSIVQLRQDVAANGAR